MKHQTTLLQIIVLGLVLCLSIGCSAPSPGAKEPQAPAPQNGPKAGHWEGEPSVTFDVTSNGTIQNFHIAASTGGGMGTCNIAAPEFKIENDQTFVISEWIELSDGLRTFIDSAVSKGATKPGTKPGASGEMVEAKHLEGKFDSPETVSGSYLVTLCENNISMTVKVPIWKAEWKK